ncbi:RagB/SusD family nutrient uptake outer membrane protein [Arsenicibacter rosenii]|uniref:RagB/SusD family nutrient uptake outer membrane protein n=1 Tax=Arsenicibacter rosenii TaxID=1750698 RepID=A0A1S2VFG4_9BACT|nr:RagB/SusD family nutrient uptake outer membrane protein [Arsenicibacter rosenii]OIN56638.1 RagB/SusD family nutrient uptake outer membrane protein [Arsenicibacter rosenii]
MKALITIRTVLLALLLAGTGSLWSCKNELDKSPLSNYVNETFWTSENNALLALTGVYRGNIQMLAAPGTGAEFSATDWWSYHGLIMLEVATDNAYDRRGDNSGINQLTNGNLVATNAYLGNYWSASYSRIARCNYFMENVAKTPVDAAKVKRMTAEARFIRACQYFYLSQTFGSVPLVTRTLSLDEANTVTKATKAEVLKFATDEFTAVAGDLPRAKDLPAAERGRATRQAALAFLGRAQLAAYAYNDAATTYKTIIDFGDNLIDPSYPSLFNGTNEASRELIFATQYVKDLAPNAMDQHFFPAVNGGWHLFNPLGSLVESYEFTDGTPFSFTDPRYSATDPTANRDPRLRYNVLFNQQTFQNIAYITHPDSTRSADQLTTSKQATRTGFGLRKYNWDGLTGDLQNSGIDLPVIRYAEVLLSYLEARLESGAVDQALLDQTINLVRGRSGVGLPRVTVTSQTQLRTILRRERRNELAFEGIRLWDLQRWKIAGDVLKGDFYGAAFPNAKNLRKKTATTNDPYSRWFVTTKNFRVGTDETWPIPQSEVNINPNLK